MDISLWGVYRTILISPTWLNNWKWCHWWQKLELTDLFISELFEDLLSWNSVSKLITPRYITCAYFGAIVAIFNFIFSVCLLYVMFFNSWAGPQSRPLPLVLVIIWTNMTHKYLLIIFVGLDYSLGLKQTDNIPWCMKNIKPLAFHSLLPWRHVKCLTANHGNLHPTSSWIY